MSVPLLAELKRRRVFRALVGYGIVAFAVLQIIEPVMHGLHWPDGVLSYVVVALAVGFPIVVALAWIFDVRGGHIERTSGGRLGARRGLLLACISAVAAAPGLIWYFGFRGTARTPAAPPSIVVLPFVNMSGDKENEYFSDGMTEEIINALANVEGLRVVARTSAFSFKGKNVDVRRIGEDLNVATVLEGSVRRQGNQLRVAAQLISLPDGYHLWSKTYERELNNVFAVEDEVARAIVQALAPKLLPGLALAQATTVNTEAHDLYLRGRYFWNQRTREALTKAQSLFEQAIALDAGYALAYSGLSDCYNLLVDYGWRSGSGLVAEGQEGRAQSVGARWRQCGGSCVPRRNPSARVRLGGVEPRVPARHRAATRLRIRASLVRLELSRSRAFRGGAFGNRASAAARPDLGVHQWSGGRHAEYKPRIRPRHRASVQDPRS